MFNNVHILRFDNFLAFCCIYLGAVHKRRPQLGGLSSADILRTKREISDADVRTLWCKKSDFSKFMVCPHGQGEGV